MSLPDDDWFNQQVARSAEEWLTTVALRGWWTTLTRGSSPYDLGKGQISRFDG